MDSFDKQNEDIQYTEAARTKILLRSRNEGLLILDGPNSFGPEVSVGETQKLPGDFAADIAEFSRDGMLLAFSNSTEPVQQPAKRSHLPQPNKVIMNDSERARMMEAADGGVSALKKAGYINKSGVFEVPAFVKPASFEIPESAPPPPPADAEVLPAADNKCVSRQGNLTVVDLATSTVVMHVESPAVQAVSWSPTGRFLLTWSRLNKESNTPNLVIWEVATSSQLATYFQKSFKRELWPTLQWTPDEVSMMKTAADELVILDTAGVVSERVSIGGIASFEVAPTMQAGGAVVAVFVPEKKGKPASVRIHRQEGWAHPVASKTFFRATECSLMWNSRGTHVICKTHTDVDATNQSYYGSTSLYMLAASGEFECQVPLTKEGPIGDVQWSPQGLGFVVTAGTMPAACTLYNTQCEPIFEFGQAHRNTVSWSPHGRFLCLAGFGNLAGQMDFWDMNKKKKMGSAESSCAVSYCWSPDSRYFMTATLSPRMNVDNGVKIFKYNGTGPVVTRSIDQLYQATFAPAAPGVYPDRPQSPKSKAQKESEQKTAAETSATSSPKKVGAYRPPHATGALSALMQAERSQGTGAGKVSASRAVPGLIPGMAPPGSAAPEKKKARRRKKKSAETGEEGPDEEADLPEETKPSEPVKQEPAVQGEPEPELSKEKRIKNLRKKLKQLDALKEKLAGGQELNEDQRSKLASEPQLIKEISELEEGK